jgi:hypothetical protein
MVERPRPTERHQRPADVDHPYPALDRANAFNLGDLVRRRPVPFVLRTFCWIAGFEYEMAARPQRVMHPTQCSIPIRRVNDRLGNIPGHRGKVDLHLGQCFDITADPSHTLTVRLGSRDIERGAGGVEARYLKATIGQQRAKVPVPQPTSSTR